VDARNERRLVTCLFIDAVGSTELMVRVGPEVMRRRLADAFTRMVSHINEHGGTVENYAGDSIFAIFGAPTARVDDAERAIRAAAACVAGTSTTGSSSAFDIRVGIETGEALIDLDAVERHERMAIGPCVNIAARLQQLAHPGQILVGPATHTTTEHVARYESLGSLELKGLGPTAAWRLVDFAMPAEGRQVPFVGRANELGQLLDAAERSAAGERLLALVTGVPGLGKSRLVKELLGAMEAQGTRVIEIRCRPAGEDGARTPLRQLLEADIPDPTPDLVRGRIDELLGPESAGPAATAILHSTGLETSAALQVITRYEQRVNIAEAWRRYLTALAARRPLIIAVEDVHWADAVLVFMLYHVTSGGTSRLMVVATARPEFAGSPLIRAADSMLTVELQPLDAAASNELAHAARGSVVGLERAEGNPLFIIELARSQAAQATEQLPLTIQAAIAARLDELAPEERQLLQDVSVVGETFDVADAAFLSDREPADVAGMLGRIAHLGFVEFAGHRYRFHHALIRDVAYGRLPVNTRAALHLRYAEEGVGSDAVARAFHLWEALKPPDADWIWEDANQLRRLRKAAYDAQFIAGKRFESWNQYEQAEEAYGRAVELAVDRQHRAHALTERGRTQIRQGKGDESWASRTQALAEYRAAGEAPPSLLYADMLEIITFNWGYFRDLPPDEVINGLIDEGLQAASAAGDGVSMARLLAARASFRGETMDSDAPLRLLDTPDAVRFADAGQRMAQVVLWGGDAQTAAVLYRRILDDLAPKGALFNELEALVFGGMGAYSLGDLARADELVRRARDDLKRGRSTHSVSHVLGLRSLVALGKGDWEELLAVTAELEALVEENPDVSFCLIGGDAIGFGAAARLHEHRPLPGDLVAVAAHLVDESEMVQRSSIMLPMAMLGDVEAVERGFEAYRPGLRLVDRAVTWDPIHLVPAVAAVMLERWDLVAQPIARLEYCAERGSLLAAAVLEAINEERPAPTAPGGPRHQALRQLGYAGISELLSSRASE
jgi:class 3 adenylate cyclase/tetratricopeptide (TPR) repeat protein